MINAPATPARCQLEVMFVGRHFHNLDAKGRVAVPHKFRSHLGGSNEGRVVITISTNSDFASLDVYPAERWEAKVVLDV